LAKRRRGVYAYYLTPQGFAEKARLTVEYFSFSFSIFRRARAEYGDAIRTALSRGFFQDRDRGECPISRRSPPFVRSNAEPKSSAWWMDSPVSQSLVGVPVFASFDEVDKPFDAVVIAALHDGGKILRDASERYGAERVYAPARYSDSPSMPPGRRFS